MALDTANWTDLHTISVVIPVYQGESTLEGFVAELLPFCEPQDTPGGRAYRLAEIVLVHDRGPDRSDIVIRRLAAGNPVVRPVFLSRNFGQHAATLAGMASSGSDWIVTMDEDGQFDPKDVARLLDCALDQRAQLVYGTPTNPPPHGVVRNAASRAAKYVAMRLVSGGRIQRFTSYRLMLGELGRGVAAYVGSGVYLDIALTWVIDRTAACPVVFREQGGRRSGYSFRRLLSHFWQLVLTAGTRPLRLVSLAGGLTALVGLIFAVVLVVGRLSNQVTVEGWTSVVVVNLLIGGAILFALGVIAEYVGVAVRMAMGKPLYLITSDPADGPLHRNDHAEGSQGP
jgi:glycosyltransferase involved in cell wall biosynthesis